MLKIIRLRIGCVTPSVETARLFENPQVAESGGIMLALISVYK